MDEPAEEPDQTTDAPSLETRANAIATKRGRAVRAVVASIVSNSGLFLMVFSGAEMSGYLPVRMPHFWYPVRMLWPLVGALLWYAGSRMTNSELGWEPRVLGRRFERVIFYTRQDCHLCDDALAMLLLYDAYLPPIMEVDIDKDAILIAKFTECVPVVEIDGKIRFRGKIDEILLRRLIEGAKPIS